MPYASKLAKVILQRCFSPKKILMIFLISVDVLFFYFCWCDSCIGLQRQPLDPIRQIEFLLPILFSEALIYIQNSAGNIVLVLRVIFTLLTTEHNGYILFVWRTSHFEIQFDMCSTRKPQAIVLRFHNNILAKYLHRFPCCHQVGIHLYMNIQKILVCYDSPENTSLLHCCIHRYLQKR